MLVDPSHMNSFEVCTESEEIASLFLCNSTKWNNPPPGKNELNILRRACRQIGVTSYTWIKISCLNCTAALCQIQDDRGGLGGWTSWELTSLCLISLWLTTRGLLRVGAPLKCFPVPCLRLCFSSMTHVLMGFVCARLAWLMQVIYGRCLRVN